MKYTGKIWTNHKGINVIMKKAMARIKETILNKKALTVIDALFIFLLSMIVLFVIMQAVELSAIVKNSRDSLERATLSVAAVNEYKLYANFRENIIDDSFLDTFVTEEEIIDVLQSELGMERKSNGVYKLNSTSGNYYYRLTNISVVPSADTANNIIRIQTSATLFIPINIFGQNRDMEFNINVSCYYASKLNAVH